MFSHLSVCPSVHPSVLGFRSLTWTASDGFYSNFAYTCISGVSGLGLLMGKFCQFLAEVFACCPFVFLFPEDNLYKYQWIFTKLGKCSDIVVIWFGLLMGKFCQFLTELSARHIIVAGYYRFTFLFYRGLLAFCLTLEHAQLKWRKRTLYWWCKRRPWPSTNSVKKPRRRWKPQVSITYCS